MKREVRLPSLDESGFLEIRFESIGGLGAHLAGQILAEAGVLKMGLNGAHFSSYGSEKKGSPVRSYVRLCAPEQEVRTSSPVESPHLIAVFHEALLKNPLTTAGLRSGGTLIVNTGKKEGLLQEHAFPETARICALDALKMEGKNRGLSRERIEDEIQLRHKRDRYE